MYYTHLGYQTSIFGKIVHILFKFLRYLLSPVPSQNNGQQVSPVYTISR